MGRIELDPQQQPTPNAKAPTAGTADSITDGTPLSNLLADDAAIIAQGNVHVGTPDGIEYEPAK